MRNDYIANVAVLKDVYGNRGEQGWTGWRDISRLHPSQYQYPRQNSLFDMTPKITHMTI